MGGFIRWANHHDGIQVVHLLVATVDHAHAQSSPGPRVRKLEMVPGAPAC
jgi:hypothetical protein